MRNGVQRQAGPDNRQSDHRECPNGNTPKGRSTGRKVGDRFAVANAFADYGARLVDTTAQSCWWIVWRETKPDGLARVSFNRIAECIGKGRRTVIRTMKRLKRAGLITVVRQGGMREGASTYRAHGTPAGVTPDTGDSVKTGSELVSPTTPVP
jgi:DNA-binding transcriptional ArsR family regulator